MAINGDYLNAYLEECQGYGFEGGPTYSTNIVSLRNGHERRNAMRDQPLHTYNTSFNNISKEAARNVKRMFMMCRGMAKAFKFKDYLDFEADQEDFSVGDGSKKIFQLSKVTVIDGIQYFRNIYSVRPGIKIYDNDVEVTSGVTVDYDRGVITFENAPQVGHILSWSGEFDIWVRFNTDSLSFTIDSIDATNGMITLIEVAPPPPV